MTRKLFWEDMYMSAFEAIVESVAGSGVLLDQTAFNPRGGGLVSDSGTIGGVRLVEATKQGDDILHTLESPAQFQPGQRVKCALDWERRYRVMRMHTAAHMLSSVVNRETGALITGNQIAPEESRVDFDLEDFDKDKVQGYVDEVNLAARRELDVETFFMKREEALATPGFVKLANAMPPALAELRIVKIGDVDTQADGGVHVRNTREIGTLTVTRTDNKGRKNRRLYFTVR